jgi:hypothetical protein
MTFQNFTLTSKLFYIVLEPGLVSGVYIAIVNVTWDVQLQMMEKVGKHSDSVLYTIVTTIWNLFQILSEAFL